MLSWRWFELVFRNARFDAMTDMLLEIQLSVTIMLKQLVNPYP